MPIESFQSTIFDLSIEEFVAKLAAVGIEVPSGELVDVHCYEHTGCASEGEQGVRIIFRSNEQYREFDVPTWLDN